MHQMAGQLGIFSPMTIQFGAYGAYSHAVSLSPAGEETVSFKKKLLWFDPSPDPSVNQKWLAVLVEIERSIWENAAKTLFKVILKPSLHANVMLHC